MWGAARRAAARSLGAGGRRALADGREHAAPDSELGSSTILLQDGLDVRELPLLVRRVKDVVVLCEPRVPAPPAPDTYPLVREEFARCRDLRDVFSLLSRCSKLTADIALGAVERIHELDCGDSSTPLAEPSADAAKGAILDKLLKVILKTEDARSLLNALTAVSGFAASHRYKFVEELLIRVSENGLTVEQLCEFIEFLATDAADPRFTDAIDKLWAGFAEREKEINEKNLVTVFNIVSRFKTSKKTMISLLDKKLTTLWWKVKPQEMQDILDVFCQEKHIFRSMSIVGRWTNTNIHSLNEETLFEILTKLTKLQYHDNQSEKALERYVKLKGIKINSHTLIVSILNHCMKFRVRNNHIFNGCSEYFAAKGMDIPAIFLKSFIHPFGYLCFHPTNGVLFWAMVETVLRDNFSKMNTEDILDIVLSCIYLQKYPLNFVDKIFNPHFLARLNNSECPDRLRAKLKLIDTAMSLECKEYSGPLLPKDHWAKSSHQDSRNKRVVNNIRETLEKVAGGADRFSTSVLIPYLFTNELYIIDVMLHPAGLGSSILNLNLKSDRNVNVAILIHVPEHYCANTDQLIGPQMMRKKHLRLLGMKVVSLKYSMLCKLNTHSVELQKYIVDSLKFAEASLC